MPQYPGKYTNKAARVLFIVVLALLVVSGTCVCVLQKPYSREDVGYDVRRPDPCNRLVTHAIYGRGRYHRGEVRLSTFFRFGNTSPQSNISVGRRGE